MEIHDNENDRIYSLEKQSDDKYDWQELTGNRQHVGWTQ